MTTDLFAARGLPHIPHPPLAMMFEFEGDCWIWQGFINHSGYGRVHTGGRKEGGHKMAHRVFYEALVEPVPDDLHLDHLCYNRLCVNPDHLEPVTNEENARRAAANRTHCRRGHLITDDSTVMVKGRKRQCRICARGNSQRRVTEQYLAEGRSLDHRCECGRWFVTNRALGVHKAYSHGIRSPRYKGGR